VYERWTSFLVFSWGSNSICEIRYNWVVYKRRRRKDENKIDLVRGSTYLICDRCQYRIVSELNGDRSLVLVHGQKRTIYCVVKRKLLVVDPEPPNY